MLKKLLIIPILVVVFCFTAMDVSAKTANALAQELLLKEVSEQVTDRVNPDGNPNIIVKAMPLDSRIRVTQCQTPLEISMKQRNRITRHFSVKAACTTSETPWNVYVQVRVYEYIEAVVTTTHVAKGEVITRDMVSMQMIEKSKVRNNGTDAMERLLGGRAMRNISRGYQISGADVCLVCKGDNVAIVAKLNNLSIKTSGTAMENGAFGDTIQVQNNSSERIVKGVIGDLRQIFIKL